MPSSTHPRDALITIPPAPLELRQNNPQDCSNLIAASVNRATVEISRTIIALNATFSQQLQQASISASNGIKSAQDSATSTINVVVQSASIATVAAFSSVTVANLAVTSATLALSNVQSSASTALSVANQSISAASSSLTLANLALGSAQATITSVNLDLTSVSSASSSEVSRLSASLNLLEARVSSIQASASAALAAAQSAIASVTGSAAAQASSILASAASATQNIAPGTETVFVGSSSSNGQPPTIQGPNKISITPGQAAAIIIGAVVAAISLSLSVYFLISKLKKRRQRDSYLDEKDISLNPKELGFRLSSASRTKNAITIKFNPPKSSDAPLPSRSALRQPRGDSAVPSLPVEFRSNSAKTYLAKGQVLTKTSISSNQPNLSQVLDPTVSSVSSSKDVQSDYTDWSLDAGTAPPAPRSEEKIQTLDLLDIVEVPIKSPYLAPGIREILPKADQTSYATGETLIQDTIEPQVKIADYDYLTAKKRILDPFEDKQMELSINMAVEISSAQRAEPNRTKDFIKTPVQEVRARDELLTNPFENSLPALAFRYIPDPSKAIIIKPTDDASDVASAKISQRFSVFDLEQLLPQQSMRVPSPEVLALLSKDDQLRTSTVPEIDTLLRIVAQQNEDLADKPLFWSDFRPPDLEAEEAMSFMVPPLPPPLADKIATSSPLKQPAEYSAISSERANKTSLPGQNLALDQSKLKVGFISLKPNFDVTSTPVKVEREPLPSPSPPIKDQDVSLLPQNPQTRNITSILAEHEISIHDTESEEPDRSILTEHKERGRSMIRTSDLIETKLSYIAQIKAAEEQAEEQLQREQIVSPLRRNPVDLSTMSPTPKEEALSPLPRSLSVALSETRKSRTVSPPRSKPAQEPGGLRDRTQSPLRRNPVDPQLVSSIRDRVQSPLRRNPSAGSAAVERQSPPTILCQAVRSSSVPRPSVPSRSESLPRLNPIMPQASSAKMNLETGLRPTSNAAFSQALSKFRTLAEQGPIEASQASTEVTQRAIAGIYIPGSLREQAVRNLSKSRERGKGAGSLSRSTSKSG